jgi:uncharacterized protein
MKKILTLCLFLVTAMVSFSQTIDLRRKIDVTGSAETEITPDIIYINIALKEYYNGNKKAADIEDLEIKLVEAVVKAGVPKENLFINNVSGYNYSWERKKNPNFMAGKQYRLKLTDPSKFNQIINALDPKSIEYTNIEGYEHSNIAEYRKTLKIQALKAAKEKAAYLAETLGDKVGDALDIQEINNDENPGVLPVYANAMVRFKNADAPIPADIDFKKIKLNYQVKVVFELKK